MASSVRRRLAARTTSEKGAVLVVSAVMMTTLIGFMGLGLDVGTLYYHRRTLQTAADAGAIAGGNEILRGRDELILSSALTGTAENGFTHETEGVEVEALLVDLRLGGHETEGVDVEVYHPPISGFHIGDTDAVEVVITQPEPTYFMRLFGWTDVDVWARAVAWAGANDLNCIYVMEDRDEDAFSYNSSAQLDADCGLRVNSSDGWGTHLTSNSNVSVSSASLTGGYVEESSSVLDAEGGVHTNVYPRSPDPLARLNPPPGHEGR